MLTDRGDMAIVLIEHYLVTLSTQKAFAKTAPGLAVSLALLCVSLALVDGKPCEFNGSHTVVNTVCAQ